jgi:radical SAM protein
MPTPVDFNLAPFILIWETTQACALACRHCRAEAIDERHPDELTTAQGKDLIDQVADMGTRVLIFSGGDPLQRDDLEDLIAHARARKLRVGTIPAATPRLTPERIQSLKDAGLNQMAMSLDGPNAEKHDHFRQVPGSFDLTMKGLSYARDLGMPIQINTVFAGWNAADYEEMEALVESLGIVFWEVFFLVPMGRGTELTGLKHEHYQQIFARLHALQKRVKFIVKITEAPHYRMYVAEAERREASGEEDTKHRVRTLLSRESGPRRSMGQAPRGVNSGKGFCFIDHTGDVFPSGFLPVSAGNVKQTPLATIYRDSELFRNLRDTSLLKGRCGRCEYNDLCGGSRARAYALTGDYLAEDAGCWYEPRGVPVGDTD